VLALLPPVADSLHFGGVLLNNRGLFLPRLHFAGGIGVEWPHAEGFNVEGGIALLPELVALTLGLAIYNSAFLAEIFRAGILSVPRGQIEAARAVGMTYPTMMRIVVLPQALRVIIPPLGNTFNGLLKTSSLASVISMEELLRRTEVLIQVQFKVLEIFIVAALYYLIMTTIWGFIQERLEAHFSRSVGNAIGQRKSERPLAARLQEMMLTRDAQ